MKLLKDIIFLPYNKSLTPVAKENRKSPTKAEHYMWKYLLNKGELSHYKFLRQKPIDNFIVDFYCSSLQLVIEVDGDSHKEKIEQDILRTEKLKTYSLQVLRYTNEEVLSNPEWVYKNILEHIQLI